MKLIEALQSVHYKARGQGFRRNIADQDKAVYVNFIYSVLRHWVSSVAVVDLLATQKVGTRMAYNP